MGVGVGFSYSAFDQKNDWDKGYSVNISNTFPFVKIKELVEVQTAPDPSKFTIINEMQVGKHLLLEIIYDEATNYEGKKILLFKDCKYMDILKTNKGVIDPHFSDNIDYISPFARFEPTNEGRMAAIKLCKLI